MECDKDKFGFVVLLRNGRTSPPYELDVGEHTIGRARDSNIRLRGSKSVTNIHAVITVNTLGVAVITNKSIAVPIQVNGKNVLKSTVLHNGDKFVVVDKEFQYTNENLKDLPTDDDIFRLAIAKASKRISVAPKTPVFKAKAVAKVTPLSQGVRSLASKSCTKIGPRKTIAAKIRKSLPLAKPRYSLPTKKPVFKSISQNNIQASVKNPRVSLKNSSIVEKAELPEIKYNESLDLDEALNITEERTSEPTEEISNLRQINSDDNSDYDDLCLHLSDSEEEGEKLEEPTVFNECTQDNNYNSTQDSSSVILVMEEKRRSSRRSVFEESTQSFKPRDSSQPILDETTKQVLSSGFSGRFSSKNGRGISRKSEVLSPIEVSSVTESSQGSMLASSSLSNSRTRNSSLNTTVSSQSEDTSPIKTISSQSFSSYKKVSTKSENTIKETTEIDVVNITSSTLYTPETRKSGGRSKTASVGKRVSAQMPNDRMFDKVLCTSTPFHKGSLRMSDEKTSASESMTKITPPKRRSSLRTSASKKREHSCFSCGPEEPKSVPNVLHRIISSITSISDDTPERTSKDETPKSHVKSVRRSSKANESTYNPVVEDITPVTPENIQISSLKEEAFKTPINTPGLFESIKKSVIRSKKRLRESYGSTTNINKKPRVEDIAVPLKSTSSKQKSPQNRLSDFAGVKRLMKSPAKSPKNDLTNVPNLRKIMSPKTQKSPVNDLSRNVSGAANLFNVSGVGMLHSSSDIENAQDLFTNLTGKQPIRSYGSRGIRSSFGKASAESPVESLKSRKTMGDVPLYSPRVTQWVEEHAALTAEAANSTFDESLVEKPHRMSRRDRTNINDSSRIDEEINASNNTSRRRTLRNSITNSRTSLNKSTKGYETEESGLLSASFGSMDVNHTTLETSSRKNYENDQSGILGANFDNINITLGTSSRKSLRNAVNSRISQNKTTKEGESEWSDVKNTALETSNRKNKTRVLNKSLKTPDHCQQEKVMKSSEKSRSDSSELHQANVHSVTPDENRTINARVSLQTKTPLRWSKSRTTTGNSSIVDEPNHLMSQSDSENCSSGALNNKELDNSTNNDNDHLATVSGYNTLRTKRSYRSVSPKKHSRDTNSRRKTVALYPLSTTSFNNSSDAIGTEVKQYLSSNTKYLVSKSDNENCSFSPAKNDELDNSNNSDTDNFANLPNNLRINRSNSPKKRGIGANSGRKTRHSKSFNSLTNLHDEIERVEGQDENLNTSQQTSHSKNEDYSFRHSNNEELKTSKNHDNDLLANLSGNNTLNTRRTHRSVSPKKHSRDTNSRRKTVALYPLSATSFNNSGDAIVTEVKQDQNSNTNQLISKSEKGNCSFRASNNKEVDSSNYSDTDQFANLSNNLRISCSVSPNKRLIRTNSSRKALPRHSQSFTSHTNLNDEIERVAEQDENLSTSQLTSNSDNEDNGSRYSNSEELKISNNSDNELLANLSGNNKLKARRSYPGVSPKKHSRDTNSRRKTVALYPLSATSFNNSDDAIETEVKQDHNSNTNQLISKSEKENCSFRASNNKELDRSNNSDTNHFANVSNNLQVSHSNSPKKRLSGANSGRKSVPRHSQLSTGRTNLDDEIQRVVGQDENLNTSQLSRNSDKRDYNFELLNRDKLKTSDNSNNDLLANLSGSYTLKTRRSYHNVSPKKHSRDANSRRKTVAFYPLLANNFNNSDDAVETEVKQNQDFSNKQLILKSEKENCSFRPSSNKELESSNNSDTDHFTNIANNQRISRSISPKRRSMGANSDRKSVSFHSRPSTGLTNSGDEIERIVGQDEHLNSNQLTSNSDNEDDSFRPSNSEDLTTGNNSDNDLLANLSGNNTLKTRRTYRSVSPKKHTGDTNSRRKTVVLYPLSVTSFDNSRDAIETGVKHDQNSSTKQLILKSEKENSVFRSSNKNLDSNNSDTDHFANVSNNQRISLRTSPKKRSIGANSDRKSVSFHSHSSTGLTSSGHEIDRIVGQDKNLSSSQLTSNSDNENDSFRHSNSQELKSSNNSDNDLLANLSGSNTLKTRRTCRSASPKKYSHNTNSRRQTVALYPLSATCINNSGDGIETALELDKNSINKQLISNLESENCSFEHANIDSSTNNSKNGLFANLSDDNILNNKRNCNSALPNKRNFDNSTNRRKTITRYFQLSTRLDNSGAGMSTSQDLEYDSDINLQKANDPNVFDNMSLEKPFRRRKGHSLNTLKSTLLVNQRRKTLGARSKYAPRVKSWINLYRFTQMAKNISMSSKRATLYSLSTKSLISAVERRRSFDNNLLKKVVPKVDQWKTESLQRPVSPSKMLEPIEAKNLLHVGSEVDGFEGIVDVEIIEKPRKPNARRKAALKNRNPGATEDSGTTRLRRNTRRGKTNETVSLPEDAEVPAADRTEKPSINKKVDAKVPVTKEDVPLIPQIEKEALVTNNIDKKIHTDVELPQVQKTEKEVRTRRVRRNKTADEEQPEEGKVVVESRGNRVVNAKNNVETLSESEQTVNGGGNIRNVENVAVPTARTTKKRKLTQEDPMDVKAPVEMATTIETPNSITTRPTRSRRLAKEDSDKTSISAEVENLTAATAQVTKKRKLTNEDKMEIRNPLEASVKTPDAVTARPMRHRRLKVNSDGTNIPVETVIPEKNLTAPATKTTKKQLAAEEPLGISTPVEMINSIELNARPTRNRRLVKDNSDKTPIPVEIVTPVENLTAPATKTTRKQKLTKNTVEVRTPVEMVNSIELNARPTRNRRLAKNNSDETTISVEIVTPVENLTAPASKTTRKQKLTKDTVEVRTPFKKSPPIEDLDTRTARSTRNRRLAKEDRPEIKTLIDIVNPIEAPNALTAKPMRNRRLDKDKSDESTVPVELVTSVENLIAPVPKATKKQKLTKKDTVENVPLDDIATSIEPPDALTAGPTRNRKLTKDDSSVEIGASVDTRTAPTSRSTRKKNLVVEEVHDVMENIDKKKPTRNKTDTENVQLETVPRRGRRGKGNDITSEAGEVDSIQTEHPNNENISSTKRPTRGKKIVAETATETVEDPVPEETPAASKAKKLLKSKRGQKNNVQLEDTHENVEEGPKKRGGRTKTQEPIGSSPKQTRSRKAKKDEEQPEEVEEVISVKSRRGRKNDVPEPNSPTSDTRKQVRFNEDIGVKFMTPKGKAVNKFQTKGSKRNKREDAEEPPDDFSDVVFNKPLPKAKRTKRQ